MALHEKDIAKAQIRFWVTTVVAGDVIRLGDIVLHIKKSDNEKLRLVLQLPDNIKIYKSKAGVET